MKDTQSNKLLLLILLIGTTALTILSLDLFAPSLPHLVEYFATTSERVKLTVSLNALTYGIGTLFYGPLSERLGRRYILIGAVVAAALSSVFCAAAVSIEQLIFARILMGLALAAEGVLVYSIIDDSFAGHQKVKAFGSWGAACAVVPIVAPILGAYILVEFGWRANFVVMAGLATLLTALLWRYLEESANTGYISLKRTGLEYARVLRSRIFVSYAVIQSTGVGYFIVFPTAIPFILNNQYEKGPEFYGYYQGFNILMFIIGIVVTRKLASSLQTNSILQVGTSFVVLGTTLLILNSYIANDALSGLTVCLAIIAFGNGFIFTTIPPLALGATDSPAGISSAALLTIQTTLGSLTSIADSLLRQSSVRQLALILGVVAVVAIGALMTSRIKSAK